MSIYLVGDIHGCYYELVALLEQVKFDPSTDSLWLTGDLVARGKYSLEVMRYLMYLGNSVRITLGNHDLNLIAVHAGLREDNPRDRLSTLLAAKDIDDLIDWLRGQPFLQIDKEENLVMTHAGITPEWSLTTAQECAKELSRVLSSTNYVNFLRSMLGDNLSDTWSPILTPSSQLGFCTSALTRMRFCLPNGKLSMSYKGNLELAPYPCTAWFSIPRKYPINSTLVFGHWSTLKGKNKLGNTICLDTGCCWGGYLTLLDWSNKIFYRQRLLKKST